MQPEQGAPKEEETVGFIRSRAIKILMDQRGTISRVNAVATAMREEGRTLLLEAGHSTSGEAIARDMGAWYDSLPNHFKPKASRGLGLVMVGSVVSALEVGLVDGWDENIYFSLYNDFAARGMPVETDTPAKLLQSYGGKQGSPDNETTKLRNIIQRDEKKTLEIFLGNLTYLPHIIQTHLATFGPPVMASFRQGVRTYAEVLKGIGIDNNQSIPEALRRATLLASADAAITALDADIQARRAQ